MKFSMRFVAALLAGVALVPFTVAPRGAAQQSPPRKISGDDAARVREEAYRANNLGVALLEQFKHREGAEAFRRALTLDPKLTLARINLAVALFNVPEADEALKEATAAAALAPAAPQPQYILGLIARSQNRTDDAASAFRRVLEIDPRDVGANVQLGQLYSQQRKYAEAVAAFRVALAEEPYNGTALYNLGTALLRAGERDEGQRVIQQFQTLRQGGAATVIGQNYLEQGRYAEALSSTGAESDLVDKRTPEVTFADATAAALPPAPGAGRDEDADSLVLGAKLPDDRVAEMRTWGRASAPGGLTLFDYDGDGDLDFYTTLGAGHRLYRNDGGRFADATAQSGALSKTARTNGVVAIAGDFDNDERPDLFVVGAGASTLYRNEGGGRFADVTAAAKIPDYPYLSVSAAFVDADHDGDLDIFVAGLANLSKRRASSDGKSLRFPADFDPAPSLLLRNNGDGTFADVTAASKLSAAVGRAVAVVPTDYDNRRDVDLLVVNFDSPPALYRNMRDGTFKDVAAEVGLRTERASMTCAAAGDVNKDGFTDFYFGRADAAGDFAMSDGKGRFTISPAPLATSGASADAPPVGDDAAQFLDYDNDGLLDLLTVSSSASPRAGVRVWRNTGAGWADMSERASHQLSGVKAGAMRPAPRALASGDVDMDGDVDLVLRRAGGGYMFARNEGGGANGAVRVRLAGKVSNRSGIGAKIEMRAGSLQQKLETYSAAPSPAPSDVVFGLGRRDAADAVRVLWPAGIVQAETEIVAASAGGAGANATRPRVASVSVTELDRKPSSCPYLYVWNGERFEFVTDFMGGGELGYWAAPGVRSAPDADEYVRIRGEQLKPRDGRYEIRVTNELEEALFMDRLQLVAVDHAEGVEVYPNEGLGNPTSSVFKLYSTRDARPPAAATDDRGRDVLARVSHIDRQYPDDFRLLKIRGYAEDHALVLDLGKTRAERDTLLLLTGWTDYAFSSDNVAASQAGLALKPPALQVRDAQGEWKTIVEDIGVPVGRPQTIVVDLAGMFLSPSREVRIVTNMRIYWDQVLVGESEDTSGVKLTRLEPRGASLRWRGFSAEVTPDGREPFGYDYARVSPTSPWKVLPGRYTREGDVRELVAVTDDMFVVSRPGDEIAVSFDARPPPRRGRARTFLLYADGFSKEMDINSSSPDGVAPLPFHGMKSYPYGERESYPTTRAHRDYIERYNTRVVAAPLSRVESFLAIKKR